MDDNRISASRGFQPSLIFQVVEQFIPVGGPLSGGYSKFVTRIAPPLPCSLCLPRPRIGLRWVKS
jgi:hypothetical protein